MALYHEMVIRDAEVGMRHDLWIEEETEIAYLATCIEAGPPRIEKMTFAEFIADREAEAAEHNAAA